jgi:hypothetical protein
VQHAGRLGFVWVRERDLLEVFVRAFQLFHSDVAARRSEFSGGTGRAGTLTSQPWRWFNLVLDRVLRFASVRYRRHDVRNPARQERAPEYSRQTLPSFVSDALHSQVLTASEGPEGFVTPLIFGLGSRCTSSAASRVRATM